MSERIEMVPSLEIWYCMCEPQPGERLYTSNATVSKEGFNQALHNLRDGVDSCLEWEIE